MEKMKKLSRAERLEIEILLDKGYSYRAIAESMGRSPNTISYEVRENSTNGVYDALKADKKARIKKKGAKFQWKKINHDKALQDYIVSKLKKDWNPDEIAGRMKKDYEPFYASKTAIYEWLYSARGQRYCKYLYTARYRKKLRKEPKTKKTMILDRVGLDKRPIEVSDRIESGHFEGDTVVSKRGGSGAMSVLIERKSRFLSVRKLRSMSPSENLRKVRSMSKTMRMKTLTLDNGIENKKHSLFGMPTYFCDPYSSWQKGGVENGNRMIRRYFPKGTDFSSVSQKRMDMAVKRINEKPRKILGYRSAYEVAIENGVLLKQS
jgi:IS30 family transposase